MPFGREVDLDPSDIVLDGDPAPPPKGAQQPPPSFQPMSIVAKWSSVSATAEHLLNVGVRVMPLECVKLGTSNLVCRLI